MRTVNPTNIKADFTAAMIDVRNTYTGVAGTALPATSKGLVAEYSFLGAAILLEGFLSDLFVAYLNNDSTRFVAYLSGRMSIEATDDTARQAKQFASIQLATHLTVENIRSILDARDFNVSFIDTADLKSKAGQWLADPYKGYFCGNGGLTAQHCASIEVTKAVRNFLAHRSKASKDAMQIALTNAHLAPGLGRGANLVHRVGSFLDSSPVGQNTSRLSLFISQLETVANQLCP